MSVADYMPRTLCPRPTWEPSSAVHVVLFCSTVLLTRRTVLELFLFRHSRQEWRQHRETTEGRGGHQDNTWGAGDNDPWNSNRPDHFASFKGQRYDFSSHISIISTKCGDEIKAISLGAKELILREFITFTHNISRTECVWAKYGPRYGQSKDIIIMWHNEIRSKITYIMWHNEIKIDHISDILRRTPENFLIFKKYDTCVINISVQWTGKAVPSPP